MIELLKTYDRGGMLKPAIPDETKQRFLALGFIESKIGGPVITSKGKLFLQGLRR